MTSIEVHHGWARAWSKLYPLVPQSDLDERFRFDRALLFKNLIKNLPRLECLEFDFDWNLPARMMIPVDFLEFDSFPDVGSLILDNWPFGHFGPNSLQSRFRPAVLQKLSLFNSFDIDNLFEILVRNDTQLKLLVVKYVCRRHTYPLHQTIDPWPEFTTFLLQQRSIEELGLNECEMRKAPMVRCALENGASLKSLDIHFHERPWLRNVQRRQIGPWFDYQLLEGIRIGCGALEKLEIDLPLEELIAVSPTSSPQLWLPSPYPMARRGSRYRQTHKNDIVFKYATVLRIPQSATLNSMLYRLTRGRSRATAHHSRLSFPANPPTPS